MRVEQNGLNGPDAAVTGDSLPVTAAEQTAGSRRKPLIREVLVVEGRYDRNTLSQVVDALIFETGGFSIFHNREKLQALRLLAEERGLIILTDSDDAGFVIRNRLKSLLPPEKVRQAFVPCMEGKERRKRKPSRQGLLGVEGMSPEVILAALRAAGVTEETSDPKSRVTAADFYSLCLTGKPGSAELRQKLAESLGLPAEISQSDLRKAVGILLTRDELAELVSRLTSG